MFRTRRARRVARRSAAVLLLTLAAATAVAPAQAASPVGYAATVLAGDGTATAVGQADNATVVDGSLYWVSAQERTVSRRAPDGVTAVVAGTGASAAPVEGPATDSPLVQPTDVAVDGATVWIADGGNYLYAVRGGALRIVAGNGTAAAPRQGAVATDSGLGSPYGVAVDPDHTVWLVSSTALVHVRADGTLDVFTGPDVQELRDVAIGPDGTVWVADYRAGDVKRLDRATGLLTTVPELSRVGGLGGYPTSIAVTTTGDVLATFVYGASGLVRWRAGTVDPLALTTGTGTSSSATFPVSTVSTGSGGLVYVVGGTSGPTVAAIAEGSAARCVPGTLDEATEGTPYSYRLGTEGWPTPTVTPVAGTVLPAGISLSDDGLLSGTPTATGGSTFDLAVSNRYADDVCSVSFRVRAASRPPAPPAPSPTAPSPTATATVEPAPTSTTTPTTTPTAAPSATPTAEPSPTAPPATAPTDEPTAPPTTAPEPTSTQPPSPPPVTTPSVTTPAPPSTPSGAPAAPPAPTAVPGSARPAPASVSRAPVPAPPSRTRPTESRPTARVTPDPTAPAPTTPAPTPPPSPTVTRTGPAAAATPSSRPPGPGTPVRRDVTPAVVLDAVVSGARQVTVALVAQRQVSVSVLLLVVVFLLVQDRLDRSDPKLAAAPLVPLPDLPYEPPTDHEDHR